MAQDLTKGPFLAINSGPGLTGKATPLSYAFDIQCQAPIDGRMIVDTLAQMYNLLYVTKGIEVYVTTTNQKFRFNRVNHPNFTAANNPAWWDDLVGTVGRTYLGTYDATTVFNETTRPGGGALVNGDYYIVSVAGASTITGVTGNEDGDLTPGDLVIWNSSSHWQWIANYIPAPPTTFLHTAILDWDTAVKAVIAANAIVEFDEDASYSAGQLVYEQVAVAGTSTKAAYEYRSVYIALDDTAPLDTLDNPAKFLLLSTTDYSQLVNRLVINDAAGLMADVVGPTAATQENEVLSIQETERRILAFAGGPGGGPINGGGTTYALNDSTYGVAVYP
jgi:hypothetical protein